MIRRPINLGVRRPVGVKCDECGEPFVPRPLERDLPGGGVEVYLHHEACGAEFVAAGVGSAVRCSAA